MEFPNFVSRQMKPRTKDLSPTHTSFSVVIQRFKLGMFSQQP